MEKTKILKYSAASGIFIVLITAVIFFYPRLNDPDFYIQDIKPEQRNKLYSKLAPIDRCSKIINRLKLLNIKYYTEGGKIERNGQFYVFDALSIETLNLFRDLFKKKFEIKNLKPGNQYSNFSDLKDENDSIMFFCAEGNAPSLLSLGMGIVINPRQNPGFETIIKDGEIVFSTKDQLSTEFFNRKTLRSGMVEPVVEIFENHGFTEWGGDSIRNPIWYYFSINPILVRLLFIMTPADGEEFFKVVVANPKSSKNLNRIEYSTELERLYLNNPKNFLKAFKSNFPKLKKIDASEFFALIR